MRHGKTKVCSAAKAGVYGPAKIPRDIRRGGFELVGSGDGGII